MEYFDTCDKPPMFHQDEYVTIGDLSEDIFADKYDDVGWVDEMYDLVGYDGKIVGHSRFRDNGKDYWAYYLNFEDVNGGWRLEYPFDDNWWFPGEAFEQYHDRKTQIQRPVYPIRRRGKTNEGNIIIFTDFLNHV